MAGRGLLLHVLLEAGFAGAQSHALQTAQGEYQDQQYGAFSRGSEHVNVILLLKRFGRRIACPTQFAQAAQKPGFGLLRRRPCQQSGCVLEVLDDPLPRFFRSALANGRDDTPVERQRVLRVNQRRGQRHQLTDGLVHHGEHHIANTIAGYPEQCLMELEVMLDESG